MEGQILLSFLGPLPRSGARGNGRASFYPISIPILGLRDPRIGQYSIGVQREKRRYGIAHQFGVSGRTAMLAVPLFRPSEKPLDENRHGDRLRSLRGNLRPGLIFGEDAEASLFRFDGAEFSEVVAIPGKIHVGTAPVVFENLREFTRAPSRGAFFRLGHGVPFYLLAIRCAHLIELIKKSPTEVGGLL